MGEWTKEPWLQMDIANATHEILPGSHHPDAEPVAILDMADYRRSCAAVNACAGISSEALEAGVLGEMREALDTLSLVVGLTAISRESQRPALQDAYDRARSVIAKLESRA